MAIAINEYESLIPKMEEIAKKYDWSFSMGDGRPYFMKDGDYALPDENTDKEDKEFLADIISEGSDELKKAILISWDNGLKLAGPCSGIKEFHKEQPFYVHFGVTGDNDIIMPLYESLKESLPEYNHRARTDGDKIRYDFNYYLEGKDLSVEESNAIFRIIVKSLEETLGINNDKKTLV